MSEEKIQFNENDFDPVNRYIDEQSAIRRSKSFWANAKSISLILIALGVLAILIAYAFYIYNKKDYLVKVEQAKSVAYERGISGSRNQISQLQTKVQNLESDTKSKQLLIDGMESKNQSLNSDYQDLQKDFNKSRDEVASLRTGMLENKEVKFYQKELDKIKEQAQKDNSSVKIDTYIFTQIPHKLPNGQKVKVVSRWRFKDSNQEKPSYKDCYIDFERSDLRMLNLGTKQSDINYENYYSDRLKLDKSVFSEIKNSKCNI
ncbi:hypothetical protein N8444_03025 [Pelagibacteraceae bacterium]|nr:hypothetical protein [Pelagibacteraceae bacterium]